MGIIVIGGNGCKYCTIAKGLLTGANLEYEYINIHENSTGRETLNKLGLTTIPQVFIDDKHIGGSVELHAFLNEGKLT